MTGPDVNNLDMGIVGTTGIARRVAVTLASAVFYLVLISGAITAGHTAQAAPPVRHVAIVETMTLPIVQQISSLYRNHMARLGHEDGISVRYTVLNGRGMPGKGGQLLTRLMKQDRPDLVLSIATIAARDTRDVLQTTDIPQVFLLVSDPVKEGFVSAIGRPTGANLAGQTHNLATASKVSLASQTLGDDTAPRRIGLLYSAYPSSEADARRLLQEQHKHPNLEFIPLHFQYSPGPEGRKAMRESALKVIDDYGQALDALWIATGPASNDLEFVIALQEATVPVIYAENMLSVKAGAMMAMLSTPDANAAAGAAITHDIFAGKFAGNIPVVRPDRFLLGLNIDAAKRLNITIPSHILELAGENVFK